MMYGSPYGFDAGLGILWVFHAVGMIAVLLGILFLFMWAGKTLTTTQLKLWGLRLLIGGAIVCILTLFFLPVQRIQTGGGMRVNTWSNAGMMNGGMMRQWTNGGQQTDSADQQKEEAEGKLLFDALQAKQKTCSDLSDDEFELIGEYVMGQRMPGSHEQMNAMIKQMMGDEGEVQMHILLAKNATGCSTGSTSTLPAGGMMNNGGGMMRAFSSSSL